MAKAKKQAKEEPGKMAKTLQDYPKQIIIRRVANSELLNFYCRDPEKGRVQKDDIYQTTEKNIAQLLSTKIRNKVYKIPFRKFVAVDLRSVNESRLIPKKNARAKAIRKNYAMRGEG